MKTRRRNRQIDNPSVLGDQTEKADTIAADIEQNEAYIQREFLQCSDLVCRRIHSGNESPQQLLVYLSCMADGEKVNKWIAKTLAANRQDRTDGEPMEDYETVTSSKWPEVIRYLVNGYAVLFTAGNENALGFDAINANHRSIDEPSSEPVIQGAKEGFIERLSVNVGLLRNYIRTSRLKMERFTLGEITKTKMMVSYIDGLADPAVIDRVRRKIASIRIDGILESGYIEELIRDDPFPIFPQVQITERPDVVAAALLEGKAAILVDNTPFVIVVPVTFWTGMQASEDYYVPYTVASFVRWIRIMFLFIAVFAPSFFVAVTTYHQEMIPTSLLLSIASAREPVPFPAMIEALIMEIMFEALREAGLRLPKAIGQTVSIVGGLVIGQAAVQAGIISTPIVIVVSTTGIAAFIIPRFNFSNGIRLLRFPVILLAGSLGLYGVALGFLAILLRLVHLKSFGVPYFAPVAPFSRRAFKDVWFRTPRAKPLRQGGGER